MTDAEPPDERPAPAAGSVPDSGPEPPAPAAAPRELELKLELASREDAEALAGDRGLRGASLGRARTQRLRSVYWDTADLGLHRRGVGLRVRDAGRTRLQTVKGPVSPWAGLFERREDEAPVAGPEPDPGAVSDPALRAALDAETVQRGASLEPVVETEFRRTSRILERDGAEIELCVDVGEVRTARGARPILEVELELRRGGAEALYALALELLEWAPLRPAGIGKAERGFAMLTGEVAAPSKARPLALAPDATLDALLEAALAEGLRQVSANAAPAARGADPEGVHQLRVGVRRLRSLLSLFREVLPPEPVAPLREGLRWLGRALGPARDLDVFLEERLEPLVARRPDDGALERLRDEARASRDEAYRGVRDTLADPRFARLLLELGRFTAGRGWRAQPRSEGSARLFLPGADVGRTLLAKRWRKTRRRARVLRRGVEAPVPALHELRIECKKLRYASGFLGPLYPGQASPRFAKRLAHLQDRLGHLNDAATAEHLCAALRERMGPEAGPAHHRAAGFVVGYTARAAEEHLEDLVADWRRLEKLGPFWD